MHDRQAAQGYEMGEAARGVLAMVAACTIWGLSGIYYKLVAHVPPLEVLAHRTLWSLVFFLALLSVQGRLRELAALLGGGREALLVAASGLSIAANWFLFIYAMQVDRAIEASLGYFIFPLVAVAMGAALLGERLSALKWSAVGLAALAVGLLTYGLGVAPWMSLALAGTFGIYGLIKGRLASGPVISVSGEVMLLAPLAVAWLAGAHLAGWTGIEGRIGGAFGHGWRDSLVLMLSGPLTALPLVLFSYATRRVAYATIGLVQYLNPTIQFLVATLVFREAFGWWHGIAFGLIWAGLAVYTGESLRLERRRIAAARAEAGRAAAAGMVVPPQAGDDQASTARSRSASSGTSGTTSR